MPILGTIALAAVLSLGAAVMGGAAAIRIYARLSRSGRRLARDAAQAERHTLIRPVPSELRELPTPIPSCNAPSCATKADP